MENMYSLQWIRDNLTFSDEEETLMKIREKLEKSWSLEDAANLSCETMDAVNKESPEVVAEWNMIEKVAWIVKEAYILGHLEGVRICNRVNRMTLDEVSA